MKDLKRFMDKKERRLIEKIYKKSWYHNCGRYNNRETQDGIYEMEYTTGGMEKR
jgi:hypothetical protein